MDLGKTRGVKKGAEKPEDALRRSLMVVEKFFYARHERGEKDEYCYALDSNGDVVFKQQGEGNVIRLTVGQIAAVKDKIFTHSHPRGWDFPEDSPQSAGYSFSYNDVILAAQFDVSEMRAVSRGYVHRLVRPEGGWGAPGNVEIEASFSFSAVYDRFFDAINAGTITMDQANANNNHESLIHLTKKLGWFYERIPYDEYTKGGP